MLLLFVTLVLVINALIGERGLMETLRARQTHAELVSAIDRLKAENSRLREDARRLRSDPATIEALARQELGLIKPGEVLFIIKDAKPAGSSDRPIH
jgi:cell division protein FtsB